MDSTPEMPKPEEASQEVTEEQAKAALQRLSPEKATEEEFVQKAKAHMQKMKTAAEELTKALGLPPEAKYEVMSIMHQETSGQEPNTQGPVPGPTQGK